MVGLTLSSTFGLPFYNKHFPLIGKIYTRRLHFVELHIIDEISMVKADMLYQLN